MACPTCGGEPNHELWCADKHLSAAPAQPLAPVVLAPNDLRRYQIANNTPVDPETPIANLPHNNFVIVGQWHSGFEGWAQQFVSHFNIQNKTDKSFHHVYRNSKGQFEIVPVGFMPS